MRSDPTFWILARATGLLAYALLTSSVLAGLGFIALHAFALVLDSSVHISVAALFVPGLVSYRPLWSAFGVLAAELMLVVYASSVLRRRIGVRAWRRLHWLTYAVFALGTVHGLAAGTDGGRPWALALYGGAVGAVTAAAGWRALVPATKGGNTRVSDRDRPLPV